MLFHIFKSATCDTLGHIRLIKTKVPNLGMQSMNLRMMSGQSPRIPVRLEGKARDTALGTLKAAGWTQVDGR
jgi:hypothetical protein